MTGRPFGVTTTQLFTLTPNSTPLTLTIEKLNQFEFEVDFCRGNSIFGQIGECAAELPQMLYEVNCFMRPHDKTMECRQKLHI